MLIVMVRNPVASEEEGEAYAQRFRNRAGLVDKHPGFLGFELLKGEGEYVSMTRWADRESLDLWMRSQAHAQAHANVPGAMGGSHTSHASHASHSPATQHGAGEARPGAGMGGPNVNIYEVVIPAANQ